MSQENRTTMPLEIITEVFLGMLYAKKCITYSCILRAPNTLDNFLLAEKQRLGENLPNMFRCLGGPGIL